MKTKNNCFCHLFNAFVQLFVRRTWYTATAVTNIVLQTASSLSRFSACSSRAVKDLVIVVRARRSRVTLPIQYSRGIRHVRHLSRFV